MYCPRCPLLTTAICSLSPFIAKVLGPVHLYVQGQHFEVQVTFMAPPSDSVYVAVVGESTGVAGPSGNMLHKTFS